MELEEKTLEFEKLLGQPFQIIAKSSKDFEHNYFKEQATFAQLSLEQQAFKKLAVLLGEQLGYSSEQILEQAETIQHTLLHLDENKSLKQSLNNLNIIKEREEAQREKGRKILEMIKNS